MPFSTSTTESTAAALLIQRNVRSYLAVAHERQKKSVAELRKKRLERFEPAPAAPPLSTTTTNVPTGKPVLSLEERRIELQRLVETEKKRIISLQAAVLDDADENLPLAPLPPASPAPASRCRPQLCDASPQPAVAANSRRDKAAIAASPRRPQRTSLDEFKEIEAQCKEAATPIKSPPAAQKMQRVAEVAEVAPPSPPTPPIAPVAPQKPQQPPASAAPPPPPQSATMTVVPPPRPTPTVAELAHDARRADEARRAAAAAALTAVPPPPPPAMAAPPQPPATSSTSQQPSLAPWAQGNTSPASSASFAHSAATNASAATRQSDDKLASILAYIEEAESTTEEQHATATAMVAHANRVIPPPPPQARQPVHLADLTSDERAVEGVERRLRFTPDRPESDAGSAFTASEAAAHDALGKGVHEAADLARLPTAPPPPPACGPTSSARGSAYASASELGNRPSARRGRPSMQSASAIVASGGSSRGGGTPAAAASPADAGNSGGGAVASGAEYVTPPGAGGSKQAQRATELANTVYAGVKHKMSAMKNELVSLREDSAKLRQQLEAKEVEVAKAKEEGEKEVEERIQSAKDASELTIKRHLEFIDRLLADKQDLAKQCEVLTVQMRSLEERYAAGEAKREEAYAKELRKQRTVWEQTEKAKREQWLADKTKEIKESTVRGLEPDIQRLIERHREETRRMEENLRAEHRQELSSVQTNAQRELSRMQEAGVAERHAAQERERDLCSQRLQEMSIHFEEQLRAQRQRQASQLGAEHEERDEARRREITRLEEELRAAKYREEQALTEARDERTSAIERVRREANDTIEMERRAHGAARGEWERAFETEVAARMEKEKALIEERSLVQRNEQIGNVVNKLGLEMAAAEQQWEGKLAQAKQQLETKLRKEMGAAQEEASEVKAKYLKAVEVQSQLESKLRQAADEMSAMREDAGQHESALNAARAQTEEAVFRQREASRMAALEAGTALAQAQGERAAMADELAQLRAEQRALLSAHASELADARNTKEGELNAVEERVRSLSAKKDAAIETLRGQVVTLQGELHVAREQLHATQQEILAFQ